MRTPYADWSNAMRAYLTEQYGGADVLRLEEVERPAPMADEIVLRVEATSMNPVDAYNTRGRPLIARAGKGWRRPTSSQTGTDVAGVVVAIGSDVRGFAVGDRVYGVASGAFAEYAVTTSDRISAAPATVDSASAAGLPVAGVTALQAIRLADVGPSGRVLVIGASGGVGTLLVQLAVAHGAEVTAVCSGRNVELVRALGAEHVVDYTAGELDSLAGPFDAIIDAAAAPPFRRRQALLSRAGRYVIVGGITDSRLLGPLGLVVRAKLAFAIRGRRAHFFIASVQHDHLAELAELVDSENVQPVVDRTMDFGSLPDAMRHIETHCARGKVLVTVTETDEPR